MDNDKRSSEFNEINPSEYNVLTQEDNCIQNITNSEHFNSSNVTKDEISKPKVNNSTNIHKSSNIFRLVSSFIAVCVVAAIVQTTFPMPLFTNLFNSTPSTSPPIVVPIVPVTATYTIDSLTATHNKIDFSVTIDNVDDFGANDYCLILVQSGCDSDEYIEKLSYDAYMSNRIVISSNITLGAFDKYTLDSGIKKIEQNKSYVMLVLKDKKIVQKQEITTKIFNYVTNVSFKINTDLTSRYLNCQAKINDEFNYDTICYVFRNLVTNQLEVSIIPKAIMDSSWASFGVALYEVPVLYELKIYCITDSSDMYYSETFTKDKITYQLIYIHDEYVLF